MSERWLHIVENHDDMAGYYDDVLNVMEEITLGPVLQAIPMLVEFPQERFWVDYDREADMLYISFRRPQQATDSVMTDKGVLLRYRDGDLIGITVLDASTR